MDSLFDKLFFPTKHSEPSIRKLTGYQGLLRNSSSLLQNIPSEYQHQLLEDSVFSTDFKSAAKLNLQSHFSTSHSTVPQFPKMTSCPKLFEEYRKVFNFSSILLDTQSRENLDKQFNSLVLARKSLIPEHTSMSFIDISNSDCNSMGSRIEGTHPLKTTDLFLENFEENLASSKTTQKSPSSGHFCLSISEVSAMEMDKNKHVEVASKSPSKDQLNVSIIDASSPNNKAHFSVTFSKSIIQPLNTSKIIKENCDLNLQMANKKTKELQKRSKKRRRRQKKGQASSTHSVNHQCPITPKNCGVTKKSAVSPVKSNGMNKCDIVCDLSVSPDSKSVQVVLPDLSSFVVTIESGDDDSDWDTNDTDWRNDDLEFQSSGLFVASFSSTTTCSLFTYKSADDKAYEEEQNSLNDKLKEVNRIWKESTKSLKNKPKSNVKVSFAPDEELEEICPVEMYERKGEWEVYATERLRFKKRINEIEKILKPCLLPDHRDKIYSTLQKSIL